MKSEILDLVLRSAAERGHIRDATKMAMTKPATPPEVPVPPGERLASIAGHVEGLSLLASKVRPESLGLDSRGLTFGIRPE